MIFGTARLPCEVLVLHNISVFLNMPNWHSEMENGSLMEIITDGIMLNEESSGEYIFILLDD